MIIRRLYSVTNIISRCLYSFNEKTDKKPRRGRREDATLEFQYRNLLRNTRIRQENGMGRFNIPQLNSMIKNTYTKQDAKVLLEAYCNFRGNFIQIPNSTTDRLILKYLEVQGDTAPIIQLYENHTFLSYFPHYDVTLKVLQSISTEPELVKAFLKSITLRKFIKINDDFIKEAMKLVATSGDSQVIQSVLSLAQSRTDMLSNRPLEMVKLINQYGLSVEEDIAHNIVQAISKKQYSSQDDLLELSNFYVNANKISQSMVLSTKTAKFNDEQMTQYLNNLHDKINTLKEQGDSEALNKFKDEYELIFSKAKLGAKAREVGDKLRDLMK